MRPDEGPRASAGEGTEASGAAGLTRHVRRALESGTASSGPARDPRFVGLPPAHPVVLIGPMGSGKSTVGRVLGPLLGLAVLDADHLFEEVHGPIAAFFTEHGEPAFRSAEADLIREILSSHRPEVVSLGGGAVISATTRRALQQEPGVILLEVDEAEALARLGGGEGRPVLAGDPASTWRRILSEREPLYREVATWTVKTTGLDAGEVAARIADLLAERQTETAPTPPPRQSPFEDHSGDAR